MILPRCCVPGCHYPVLVVRKTKLVGPDAVEVKEHPASDRCSRHEWQRPLPKPVSVEDFDPAKHL